MSAVWSPDQPTVKVTLVCAVSIPSARTSRR